MLDLIGVVVAFAIIIALRLRNVDFSISLLTGSLLIVVTSSEPVVILIDSVTATITDPSTWNLTVAVALITVLGYVLKETDLISELIEGLRSVVPSSVLMAVIPAIFGLFAMPGGALISAPFNEPEADRLGLRPEHRTYINIWFRHLWYWASPTAPLAILATTIACLDLNAFLFAQLPVFAVTVGLGLVVSRSFIKRDEVVGGPIEGNNGIAKGLIPIVTILGLSYAGVPLWAAFIAGILSVYLVMKVPTGDWAKMVVKGVRWDTTAAVVAMLFFRNVVSSSGSVASLLVSVTEMGVPLIVLFIVPPLLVGSISGTASMGAAIVLPLLLPFCGASLHLVSVIYAGIIAGYMASPLHLCLILTNSYYKSELGRVYRYLVPSMALLYVVAVVYHLTMYGGLPV
jgi:integral membrane protein (TIGR00529 family)